MNEEYAAEERQAIIPEQLVLAYGACGFLGWQPSWAGAQQICAIVPEGLIRSRTEDMVVIETTFEGKPVVTIVLRGGHTVGERKTSQRAKAFSDAFEKVSEASHELRERWRSELQPLREKTAHQAIRFNAEDAEISALNAYGPEGRVTNFTLIGLNLLVFILMALNGVGIFDPTIDGLIRWGASDAAHTLGGEPWRLLTSVFIHIGVIHLLMNVFALWQIGTYLAPMLGSMRYLSAYISCGIAGSLLSLWWHGSDGVVSAGASGAIFGMFGLFGALLLTKLIPENRRQELLKTIGLFILINLGYGMKSGIDNAAHIGGLVAGFAWGFALAPQLKRQELNRFVPIALLAATLFGAFLFIEANGDQSARFAAIENQFVEFEKGGLKPFDGDSTTQPRIVELREAASQWDSAEALLSAADKLKLSSRSQSLLARYHTYTSLRRRENRLMQQYIEGDFAVVDSINDTRHKIEALLQKTPE
jgi:rhomboid protease GluP